MLNRGILLIGFSLLVLLACSGGNYYGNTTTNHSTYDTEYYESRGLTNKCIEKPDLCNSGSTYYLPPPTISSDYKPGAYRNNDQGFQAEQNDSDDRWEYIPPTQEQKPQPNFYINSQTGNSYLRLGDNENSFYVDPKGNTLMPLGDWKIDTKGNTYMPMGDWYIDSHGNTLMPLD